MHAEKLEKDLVRRLIAAQSAGDDGMMREVLSPELLWHHTGAHQPLGLDDYLGGAQQGKAAFTDLTIDITQLVAEGDQVAARYRISGHHTGKFLDLEPTGKPIDFVSMWIYRIVDSAIVEAWSLDEDFVAGLRQQSSG